jgi:hypothetical protein
MKRISEIIQGNESGLRNRVCQAVLETDRQSLIRRFEKEYDSLDEDGQLELANNLLKNSNLFY